MTNPVARAGAAVLAVVVALATPAAARPQVAGLAQTVGSQQPPELIVAPAGVLIDVSDGRVLWGRNSDSPRAPASTTKIMTALLVLEGSALDETVEISDRAVRVGEGIDAVRLGLLAGERRTVGELLYALMLPSANDAAVALAEHISGSEAAFVEAMNARAGALGAIGTQFRNSHGLDEPGHYSTALDLSRLAAAALKLPGFREIVSTPRYRFPGYGSRPARMIENRNRLLTQYRGADGIKTGTTAAAGRSIVASASRGSEKRIAVVLGSPIDVQSEAAGLLDYGFGAFERLRLSEDGTPWGHATFGDGSTAALIPVESLEVLVPIGVRPLVEFRAGENRLAVSLPAEPTTYIEITLECVAGTCDLAPRRGPNLVELLWILLAPLARALDSAG